ncbi:MAG: MmgE/PrpD family protein [Betaproteobacteria bacterium]|nr:MmgE/PrpD family protein [Betaproteobacteria bacterium]
MTGDSSASGATRKLARHAATLRFEALPPTLVELTKQCVLDTLGVSIGASTLAPEGGIIHEYVTDLGGRPESTILGFGGKAPAAWAVFVNGSLGHMLDYDDVGEGGHVSISTVPVAFGIAEKIGTVTGKDLITAVAAGTDLHTRLALAVDIPDWTMTEGWFATQLFGYLSGAATAGRLLALDETGMENALGIGYNQLSGSRQMAVGAATHMRSMQAGFSGQAAVCGAELARRGIIGCKEIVEGRYGLFRNYVRTETPRWGELVGELGTRFPLLKTHGFKVWPACAYTRPTNAAITQLRDKSRVRPEDVESIAIVGGTGGTQLLCEPLASKRRPRVSIDGKYSIPFTTAVMMVKGSVTLRDYTDEGLHDPTVLAMADRISYRPDPTAEKSSANLSDGTVGGTTVEIRTRDGRVLSSKPDGVPGDARNPVGWPLLESKFRDCVSFSAKPVPPMNVDRVIEMIRNLENVGNPTEILSLLT